MKMRKIAAMGLSAVMAASPDVEVLARIHRKMKQRKTIPRVLFIT